MRRLVVMAVVVLVAGVVVSLAAGSESVPAGQWVVRDLGPGAAIDLNDRGEVLIFHGSSREGVQPRGAVWVNGTRRYLGKPGVPSDINERGEVVGHAPTKTDTYGHAFLWQGGPMRDLGTLGGAVSNAVALNDLGQVTGDAATSRKTADGDGIPHAFLWQDGSMRDITPRLRRDDRVHVLGIANSSMVVMTREWSNSKGYKRARALVWQSGRTRDLGDLGGAVTEPTDFNERGQIVGYSDTTRPTSGYATEHAFLWQDGTIRDLGVLAGMKMSQAEAINDAGQVVGTSFTDTRDRWRLFSWHAGRMRALGSLDGDWYWEPDINDRGQVIVTVGSGPRDHWGDPTVWKPYVWDQGRWTLLPSLPGKQVTRAFAINEQGQIVGNSSEQFRGERAVLWTKTG
jgi:probable HAF family extracellular repeat protein